MTSAVTEVIRRSVQSSSSATVSTAVGIVVVVLLLVLLIQKELLRAHGGARVRIGVKAIDAAIVPLLLTSVVIVVLRLATIYRQSATNSVPRGSNNRSFGPPSGSHGARPGRQGPPTPVPSGLERPYDVLLNPSALYFSRQRVRTSSARRIVHVVSIDTQPLSVRAAITGTDRRDFVAHDGCGGASLRSYHGCTVAITFIPQRTGPRHATLVVTDTSTGRSHTVPLNGQGTDDLTSASER